MELVIRKYFWAVNLCFVALAALLAAKTVNLFLEAAIAPAPSAPTARSVGRTVTRELPAALDLVKLSQLTNLPLPSPEAEAAEQAKPDMSAEPVRTSLRVKLLGTLLSSAPGWSIGSVLDLNNQKASTVMVGDRVQNAEVLSIERDRVIIANNGRREYIGAEPGDGAPVPPPVATTRPLAEPGGPVGAGIKALDENNYEIPRNEVDRALANLNDLAMQARIVPAFKDGQAEGFKLFSIRPDSLYSKIGIVNGDVIKRINGFEMNSPEKALEVYTKLKDANRIDIELDRNGSTLRKTYNVR